MADTGKNNNTNREIEVLYNELRRFRKREYEIRERLGQLVGCEDISSIEILQFSKETEMFLKYYGYNTMYDIYYRFMDLEETIDKSVQPDKKESIKNEINDKMGLFFPGYY